MKRRIQLVTVAVVAAAAPALLGCNVIIGNEDHEAFPDNCGAEALTAARLSFSDDRNGHCYSLVRAPQPPTDPMMESGSVYAEARDSCTMAGGQLACINDAPELELISQKVQTSAWLGMTAFTSNGASGFQCLSGDTFNPDFRAWAEGFPDSMGGNCTILTSDGMIENSSCSHWGVEDWLCELEPTSSD